MARLPEIFYSSCLNTPPWVDDSIMRLKEEQERIYEQEIFGVPQYKISTDYYGFTNPQVVYKTISTEELEKMFKKETNKMEAKKCDRCGKLYEMEGPCDDISMKVRFKHKFISCKEDMSENKIIEKQTEKVNIHYDGYVSGNIDLCPECRESFKKWFEES